MTPFWYVAESKGKAFVDFQHDVTREDVALAAREGFQSVEHLKRYTTLGMGDRSGQELPTSTASRSSRQLTGRTIPEVGTTVFRPPYTPVRSARSPAPSRQGIQADATDRRSSLGRGARRDVRRSRALAACAVVRTRARTDWLQTVTREVKGVRSSVGVCDVSTLGKIDIQGRRRRDVSGSRLHQHVLDAAGRQDALRADVA